MEELAKDPWNITYTLSENTPTLCLNMIVKNESQIILRLLESVVGLIQFYCICDTGSTDNTVELIEQFFQSRNIPGKIVHEPFQDFGYNRAFSLKACEDINADYVLLLDADMIFQVGVTAESFRKNLSKADVHYIFQGTDAFFYKNVRVVKNRVGMSYWGVTHEYVTVPNGRTYNQIAKSDAFIRDIGDGGSKADKFLRDIRLLKKGLETTPNNDRYTFYLANSLKDSGQYDEAIEYYRKRIQLGGWLEEVWHSYYSIGACYLIKGDMGNAIYEWFNAYQVYPQRIENLYQIIHYYRNENKPLLAYPFLVLAKNELAKSHKLEYLFMQKDIYDYKIDYEMTIVGYYCNTDSYDLVRLSMNVLAYPYLADQVAHNILSNYKFYTKGLTKGITKDCELIALLKTVGVNLVQDTDFISSTPSLLQLSNNKLAINTRYVNYSIGPAGEYLSKATIETKNVLAIITYNESDAKWVKESEVIVQHDTQYDNKYVGIEDIRLFTDNSDTLVQYNGNRGMPTGKMEIELGKINIVTGVTSSHRFPHIPNQGAIEKNWVMFLDSAGAQKMIYGWSPLVIGNITEGQGEKEANYVKTHEIKTPYFFKFVRGSTNGVHMGNNEIWFICHAVSYEDRRYYYHLVVVLDATTYQLKKYTPLFTFEKEKVEYTLGFVYSPENNTLLIGYSVMDCRTEFIQVSKTHFDEMMIL